MLLENDNSIDTIYLGAPFPGESITKTVQLRNISDVLLFNIQLETGNDEVIIVSAPKELDVKSQGDIVLKYFPKLESKKGLNIVLLGSYEYLS
jgi:hypothetical protein